MKNLLVGFLLLAACGSGSGTSAPDGSTTITFAGQAASVSYTGLTPMAYLDIEAFDRDDEVTPIATTVTDQLGNFSLAISTGAPFDGYLRARETGFVDTYLYPPHPITTSYEGAPLRMADASTLDLLADVCASSQLPGQGTVVAIATDTARKGVAGATLGSTPASNKYCYNGEQGWPSSTQLATSADGVGYLFNVVGPVTVTAAKPSTTFAPRQVSVRPAVVTMVLLAP